MGRRTELDGRYTLAERLGRGTTGEVWRAEDRQHGREVAVKVFRPGLLDDAATAARFHREARELAALDHPNVVRVFDHGAAGDLPYVVMELVDGRPLSEVAAASGGGLPPGRVLDHVAQALDGLHAAHQRAVVHRAVKPSNLLVCDDGRLLVTDFGLARAADTADLGADAASLATACHTAPEQAEGRGSMPASDLYALGVVCHELLTGTAPFQGATVAELLARHLDEPAPPLPPTLPEPLRDFVARALAKRPEDRFADAAAMAAAARQVAAALPAARRPATPRRSPERAGRRRRVPALVVVPLAVLATTATVLYVYPSSDGPDTAPSAADSSAPAATTDNVRAPAPEPSASPSVAASQPSPSARTSTDPATPTSPDDTPTDTPTPTAGGDDGADAPRPTREAPNEPDGCGGGSVGALTSVADGLGVGLAGDALQPGTPVVAGGVTDYGWHRTETFDGFATLTACDANGPSLGLDRSSRAVLLPGEVGWAVDDSAPEGVYLKAFGRCLANNGAGEQLTLRPCVPGDARQMWRLPS